MTLTAIEMIQFSVCLFALLLFSCLCSADTVSGIRLMESNETKYVITLATDASLPEKNAASELSSYLKKVTGADFKIVAPGQSGKRPVIAVGPGAAKAVMPKLDLDKAGLGEEGIVMKTSQANLVLTGATGSRRGTLYAVYEFLEQIAGVRWWTHTEETVPYNPKLTVKKLDVRYVPQFKTRQLYSWSMVHTVASHWYLYEEDKSVKDWQKVKFAVRMRNNGYGSAIPASFGGSVMPLGWCHTFYTFIPPSVYFEKHPDWFSEIEGKRASEESQLCMTNDEMLAELAKNVIAKIEEQPHFKMVALSQNDNGIQCGCSKCMELDEAEGSPSGSLLYGVNKVAEIVEKKFPDVDILTLAYQYSSKPPKTIRPRKNVVIQMAFDLRSFFQPLDSDINRQMINNVKVWFDIGAKIMIWDYYLNYNGPLAPHPNLYTIGPDIRQYRDNNAVGVFLEDETVATNYFVALKTYLASHMLWDPSRNENAIMDEFLKGYYGDAAPALRRVIDVFEKAASGVTLRVWPGSADAGWMTLDDMNTATKLFAQAESAVAGDKVLLARVKRTRIPLDHQWLHGYQKYRAQSSSAGTEFLGPEDPVKAAADFSKFVLEESAAMRPSLFTSVLESRMDKAYLDSLAKRALGKTE